MKEPTKLLLMSEEAIERLKADPNWLKQKPVYCPPIDLVKLKAFLNDS